MRIHKMVQSEGCLKPTTMPACAARGLSAVLFTKQHLASCIWMFYVRLVECWLVAQRSSCSSTKAIDVVNIIFGE